MRNDRSRITYCSALATALKVPFTVVPIPVTPAIMRMERKTAIRAYSMDVTPALSFTKSCSIRTM